MSSFKVPLIVEHTLTLSAIVGKNKDNDKVFFADKDNFGGSFELIVQNSTGEIDFNISNDLFSFAPFGWKPH